MDQPSRTCGQSFPQHAKGGFLHRADQGAVHEPVALERLDHALLVAGGLEVDVELHAVVGGLGEVCEPLFQRVGHPGARIGVVVRQPQLAPAIGVLGQDVELDHVHPRLQSGLEGGEGVAGRDVVGPLVTDAEHRHVWHPGHQYVTRLPSP